MSRIYFTADLHFGHDLVAGHRGYDEAGDHDEMIVQVLIDTLPAGSTLWILGDAMGWGVSPRSRARPAARGPVTHQCNHAPHPGESRYLPPDAPQRPERAAKVPAHIRLGTGFCQDSVQQTRCVALAF